MTSWRIRFGLRMILMGLGLIFGSKPKGKKGKTMTFANNGASFGAAVTTKTGIFGAIGATLAVVVLWMDALKDGGSGITKQLIVETIGLYSLWAALVSHRQAVAKGPAV